MRSVASVGIFHEDAACGFSLTAVSEHLRSDIAGTCAPIAAMMGRPTFWQAWGDLLYAVRTGTTVFDHIHGRGAWEHRAKHPDEGEIFDRAMAARTEQFANVQGRLRGSMLSMSAVATAHSFPRS
jgi:hypothetical protein